MCVNDRFTAAVYETLRYYAPDIKGSRVTVAVSGGADSVALCHFLASHAQELEIQVRAAHLNHALRGSESDADEAFVQNLCERLSVPLVCGRLAPDGKHPSEAHLRDRRYEFLWHAAPDGFLATAHTLTDSCETLLLHMARGSRLGGLRGIPARQGRLLRPLITLTREDVEAYCAQNDLSYVNDSSNASEIYARNRVRHGAMPALKSVNPAAERALGALMGEANELYDYLSAQANALLERALRCEVNKVRLENVPVWSAEILAGAPDVVLRHALTQLLGRYGDCSAARVSLAVECVRYGGAVEWCAGVRLRCADGCVYIEDAGEPEILPEFSVPAKVGKYQCAPGISVEIRRMNPMDDAQTVSVDTFFGEKGAKAFKIHKKDLNNCLDYDKISSMLLQCSDDCVPEEEKILLLRFRRPGDRFAPGRGRGDKSLKKWFNESACPPRLRGKLPLLAVGSRVVWLAGSGAADGFAAEEDAHTVWEIVWHMEGTEELGS